MACCITTAQTKRGVKRWAEKGWVGVVFRLLSVADRKPDAALSDSPNSPLWATNVGKPPFVQPADPIRLFRTF